MYIRAAVRLMDAPGAASYVDFSSSVSVFYRFGSLALCFPLWTDGASATLLPCLITCKDAPSTRERNTQSRWR